MKGICCGCQSEVEIEKIYFPYDEDELHPNDCLGYLVSEHDFCGHWCEGSGQVPQVVLEEENDT